VGGHLRTKRIVDDDHWVGPVGKRGKYAILTGCRVVIGAGMRRVLDRRGQSIALGQDLITGLW